MSYHELDTPEITIQREGEEPIALNLIGWIDAREVDPNRTLDYLKVETETNLEKKSDGGEGVADLGMGLEY